MQRNILIFGSAAKSGKTLTSLGLLSASIIKSSSAGYKRIQNDSHDMRSVMQLCPKAKLIQDVIAGEEVVEDPMIKVVETHGGILSKSKNTGILQAAAIKNRKSYSTILVGDCRGGEYGLSSTLLSYEALLNRDFNVSCIVYFNPLVAAATGSPLQYLSQFVTVPVVALRKPKDLKNDPLLDYTNTLIWLEDNQAKFSDLLLKLL